MVEEHSKNSIGNEELGEHEDHRRSFVTVFLALCALTAVSVAIANLDVFPNKSAKWAAFLGVAFVKAFLVAAYFMHLRWEKIWKYALTIPALTLATILALSLYPDIGMRYLWYSHDRIIHGPEVDLSNEDVASPVEQR